MLLYDLQENAFSVLSKTCWLEKAEEKKKNSLFNFSFAFVSASKPEIMKNVDKKFLILTDRIF